MQAWILLTLTVLYIGKDMHMRWQSTQKKESPMADKNLTPHQSFPHHQVPKHRLYSHHVSRESREY